MVEFDQAAPPAWSLAKRRAYLDGARTILADLGEASPMLRRRFEQTLREYERHFQEQVPM